MDDTTLLARFSLAGPARTANPRSAWDRAGWDYRRRVEQAARATHWRKRIPTHGDLGLRIRAFRAPGTVMDADNIAKPVLDGLSPWIGRVGNRVADERIAHLEVRLDPCGPETIDVELHDLISYRPARAQLRG